MGDSKRFKITCTCFSGLGLVISGIGLVTKSTILLLGGFAVSIGFLILYMKKKQKCM